MYDETYLCGFRVLQLGLLCNFVPVNIWRGLVELEHVPDDVEIG